jgi:hypothetical protein
MAAPWKLLVGIVMLMALGRMAMHGDVALGVGRGVAVRLRPARDPPRDHRVLVRRGKHAFFIPG